MLNKLYDKIMKYIKKNFGILLAYVILLCLIFITVPYEIQLPGGLINMEKRIVVENEYKSMGSLNLTYVAAKKGNLLNYLLSFIIPSWEATNVSNMQIEDESVEEINDRYELSLKDGVNASTFVAYTNAGKEVKIEEHDLTVLYVYNDSKCDLKIGDVIESINNVKPENVEVFSTLLQDAKESVDLKINRKNKMIKINCPFYKIDDKKYIGVALQDIVMLKTNPKVEYKFKKGEYGSSGGLMNALTIYNKLVKNDITKGKVISGTGTIDMLGNVGKIDGVKYKLLGASKSKAEVFFVPNENYEEALKVKKDYKLKIPVVEIKTFKDALVYLENI